MSVVVFKEFGLIAAGVAVIIAYAAAVSVLFRRITEKRKTEQKRFSKALSEGLSCSAVSTLEDVQNIYRGIRRLGPEAPGSPARLSKWLREYLVELLEEKEKGKKEEFIERNCLVTEFISQNEQQSPYANLPDLERSIITDIEVFLDADDKSAVKRKLSEITASIQAREDSFARIKGTNRWSVPLAVIGVNGNIKV
ncbi:MAG: hypothetical protein KAQ71_20440, partial [Desulfobulbaceae bacterium]|nr:hypothetical protein [Desulfobulbaceae bacterium]